MIPLGLEIDGAVEGVVFGNADDVGMIRRQPVVDLGEHGAAGLVPGVAGGEMPDVVDRVPAEAVDVIFLHEHPDLAMDVILHFLPAEIGPGVTPHGGGFPLLVVEVDAAQAVLRPAIVLPQLQVGRAIVIVHDVHQDGDAVLMAGLDEALEAVRAAERGFHGIGIGGIVAPGKIARKFHHRHQLYGRDAQGLEVGDFFDAFVEGGRQPVLSVERAHMHFIDDQIIAPNGVEIGSRAPIKGLWIVDDGVAVGIDNALAAGVLFPVAVDFKLVVVADAGARAVHRPQPTGRLLDQWCGAPAVETAVDADGSGIRRPGPECHAGPAGIGIRDCPHAGPG